MRAFMVTFISVFFISYSQASYSEDGRGNHSGAPVRPTARGQKETIPPAIKKWITENFHLAPDFIEEQWGDNGDQSLSLPSALKRLSEGNYDQMAKIVAQLMGTANPDIAKKAFGTARAELLARHDKATSENPQTKNEYDFFESMLFGFWEWPEKDSDKLAFCGEAINQAKEKNKGRDEAAFKPAEWSSDPSKGLGQVQKAFTAQDDVPVVEKHFLKESGDEDSLKKNAKESCFNGKNKRHNDFKTAFDPAAKEVWDWNQEYHKNKDVIADAKSTADAKSDALKQISEKTGGTELFSFAQQQARSEWVGKEDGKDVNFGKKASDFAYRAIAGIQAGNKDNDPRTIQFVASNKEPLGGPVSWKVGESANDKIAERDDLKPIRDLTKAPQFVWPKDFKTPKPPTAAKPTTPAQPGAGTAEQTPKNPPTGTPPADAAAKLQAAKTAFETSKQQLDTVNCAQCHSGDAADRKSRLISMDATERQEAVSTMLGLNGAKKLSDAQKIIFEQWSKAKSEFEQLTKK